MRKRIGAILVCLLVAAVFSFGRKEETLQQLIARAEAARPDQQSDLFVEVAERELPISGSSSVARCKGS
jgi:hypothetical protein